MEPSPLVITPFPLPHSGMQQLCIVGDGSRIVVHIVLRFVRVEVEINLKSVKLVEVIQRFHCVEYDLLTVGDDVVFGSGAPHMMHAERLQTIPNTRSVKSGFFSIKHGTHGIHVRLTSARYRKSNTLHRKLVQG